MNKLGVHALVWEAGWSHEECARAIARSAETGYDFIEAPSLDPGSIDVDFTRRQLEAAGIGINFSMGLDADTDISSGEPEKAARGKQRLEGRCPSLATAAHPPLRHPVFGLSKVQRSAHRVRCGDVLRHPAPGGGDSGCNGITLGLEVVNRYELNLLNTASQAVEMCRRIGAPNVKAHLDVYHMNIEESEPAQAIVETGDYLGLPYRRVHRGYMGSGTIDMQSIFRALVRSAYGGPITFESFSSRVVGRRSKASSASAQPLGRRRGFCIARADVYSGSAQGRARGAAAGRAQQAALGFASRGCPFKIWASTHASPSPQAESTPPREKPDKRPRWSERGLARDCCGPVRPKKSPGRNPSPPAAKPGSTRVRAGLGQRSAGRPRSREGDLQRCDRRGTSRRKANRHLHLDRVRGRHHGAGAERGRPGQ